MKNGENKKKRGFLPGKNQAETPPKDEIRSKVFRDPSIRSMEKEFANYLEKSSQTRMKTKKSGLNI